MSHLNRPFVGRQNELKQIKELMSVWNSSKILFVHSDDGGVGKTRLLQEVFLQDKQAPLEFPIVVPQIIDFDDPRVKSRGALQRQISKVLGDKHFENYLKRVISFRKTEHLLDIERTNEELNTIKSEMFACLQSITKRERVVLLLDTSDKLDGTEVLEFLQELVQANDNLLIIIAGRNTKYYYQETQQNIPENSLLMILEPLSQADSLTYVHQVLDNKNQKYDPSSIQKINALAKGRPILLDLATEQLASDPEFENVLKNVSKDDLDNNSDNNSDKARIACEKALIKFLEQPRTAFQRLLLLLAHVYPLNQEMIITLQPDTRLDIEDLIQKAKSSTLIKVLPQEQYSLHDEIRRMINSYVWVEIDDNFEKRKKYSLQAIDQLQNRLAKIDGLLTQENEAILASDLLREKDVLTLQVIQHKFLLDRKAGMKEFTNQVNRAIQGNRRRFAAKLVRMAGEVFISTEINNYEYELKVLESRVFMEGGVEKCQQAKENFLDLLSKHYADTKKKAQILNYLGKSEELLGNLEQALQYEQEALPLYAGTNDYSTVANYIGYIYRRMGMWEKAKEYYELALDSLTTQQDLKTSVAASTLNNLAYVVNLQGNYEEAREYCLQAIDIWKKELSQNNSKAIARGWLTRAIIYRDRGKYDEATNYFERVLADLSDEEESYDILTFTHFDYAWNLWFEAESLQNPTFSKATISANSSENLDFEIKALLNNARNHFEKSLSLAERYGLVAALPGIYNQSSNVYWLLGQKDKAKQNLSKAYELSVKYHDIRYAIDSLLGFAEFDIAENKFSNIENYALELKENYEDKSYSFPLFYGRMRRIQAMVAFHEHQLEKAMNLFAEGIALISRHGGYGMYFIDRELILLEDFLYKLPVDVAIQWINYFIETWTKEEIKDDKKLGKLLGWCRTHKIKIKLENLK